MNWLYIHTSKRTAPEFVGSEPIQRATWICLLLYCCEQENGGLIRDCAGWGDRRWMQTCAVTKAEVGASSDLWRREDSSIRVWGYPVQKEAEMKAKREGGRRGGRATTQAKIQASRENGAKHIPSSTQAGTQHKVREGKVREGKIITAVGETRTSVHAIPSLQDVLTHAQTIGMSESDAREFHEFWTACEWRDKAGLPVRWKPAMVSRKNSLANERAKPGAGGSNGRNTNRGRSPATQYQAPGNPYAGAF